MTPPSDRDGVLQGQLPYYAITVFEMLLAAAVAPCTLRQQSQRLSEIEGSELRDALTDGGLPWGFLLHHWAVEFGRAPLAIGLDVPSDESITVQIAESYDALRVVSAYCPLEYSAPSRLRNETGPIEMENWPGRDMAPLRAQSDREVQSVDRYEWLPLWFPDETEIAELMSDVDDSKADPDTPPSAVPVFGIPSLTLSDGEWVGEYWLRFSPDGIAERRKDPGLLLRMMATLGHGRLTLLKDRLHEQSGTVAPGVFLSFNNHIKHAGSWYNTLETLSNCIENESNPLGRAQLARDIFDGLFKQKDATVRAGSSSNAAPGSQSPTYRVRILHLSDCHFRSAIGGLTPTRRQQVEREAWQRERVLGERWTRNLAELLHDRIPIDVVCVTGDIADWGLPQEYAHATEWLEQTLGACNVDFGRCVLVPGNHDIQRSTEADAWQSVRDLLGRVSSNTFSDWIAGGSPPFGVDDRWRSKVFERSRAWRDWSGGGLLGATRPEFAPGHPFLGFRHRLEIPAIPFPVHVIGLDSAWLAGDDNDHGKLRITEGQVGMNATAGGQTLGGLRIALVHHPLEECADGQVVRRLLADHADLLLRGHQHVTLSQVSWDPDRKLLELAAGSLYEGTGGTSYPNAFQVIDITTDAAGRPLQYDIRFRSWSPNGFWHDDSSIYEAATNGRLTIGLSPAKQTAAPPSASSNTPDYRAQLLAQFRRTSGKRGQCLTYQTLVFPLMDLPGYSGDACKAALEQLLRSGVLERRAGLYCLARDL